MALPSLPNLAGTIGNTQNAINELDLPTPPGPQASGQLFLNMFNALGEKIGVSVPFPNVMPPPLPKPPPIPGLPPVPQVPQIASTLKLPF